MLRFKLFQKKAPMPEKEITTTETVPSNNSKKATVRYNDIEFYGVIGAAAEYLDVDLPTIEFYPYVFSNSVGIAGGDEKWVFQYATIDDIVGGVYVFEEDRMLLSILRADTREPVNRRWIIVTALHELRHVWQYRTNPKKYHFDQNASTMMSIPMISLRLMPMRLLSSMRFLFFTMKMMIFRKQCAISISMTSESEKDRLQKCTLSCALSSVQITRKSELPRVCEQKNFNARFCSSSYKRKFCLSSPSLHHSLSDIRFYISMRLIGRLCAKFGMVLKSGRRLLNLIFFLNDFGDFRVAF